MRPSLSGWVEAASFACAAVLGSASFNEAQPLGLGGGQLPCRMLSPQDWFSCFNEAQPLGLGGGRTGQPHAQRANEASMRPSLSGWVEASPTRGRCRYCALLQ